MGRVVANEVKEILDTSLTNARVDVFINAANLTITKYLGSSTDLSAEEKKEIERWFTAHLIATGPELQASQEEVLGETSIKYQGKTGMGLEATLYGQQCLVLDTTGTLAAKLGKKKATITAVTSFD